MAQLSDLAPATDAEFILILAPCLQLVAPVGMTVEAQDTWFEAARMALARFPAGLLRRGAEHAMMHADHPSKIVPLIVKEIGPAFEQRQRIARSREADAPAALPAPGAERGTRGEIDAICKRHRVGRYAPVEAGGTRERHGPSVDPDRPCRAPTRADYLRMGVAADVLDSMGLA